MGILGAPEHQVCRPRSLWHERHEGSNGGGTEEKKGMTKRTAESLPTFGHAVIVVVITRSSPSTLHTNPEPQPNTPINRPPTPLRPQPVFRANPPTFWDVVV